MTVSPALTQCVEKIDAAFERIEQMFEQSREDHEHFLRGFAAASKRLEEVRKGEVR